MFLRTPILNLFTELLKHLVANVNNSVSSNSKLFVNKKYYTNYDKLQDSLPNNIDDLDNESEYETEPDEDK